MKIKKALKEKNKLVASINQHIANLSAYNSVEEGSEVPYSALESLASARSSIDALVDLKTAIHKANSSVYSKIFKLAELKSLAAHLKRIDCTSGKVATNPYMRGDQAPVIKTAALTVVKRDELVKEIEAEIESIQEELDAHNATKNISI